MLGLALMGLAAWAEYALGMHHAAGALFAMALVAALDGAP